jgi:hypothetical protein
MMDSLKKVTSESTAAQMALMAIRSWSIALAGACGSFSSGCSGLRGVFASGDACCYRKFHPGQIGRNSKRRDMISIDDRDARNSLVVRHVAAQVPQAAGSSKRGAAAPGRRSVPIDAAALAASRH